MSGAWPPNAFVAFYGWNQRTFLHLNNETFAIFTVHFGWHNDDVMSLSRQWKKVELKQDIYRCKSDSFYCFKNWIDLAKRPGGGQLFGRVVNCPHGVGTYAGSVHRSVHPRPAGLKRITVDTDNTAADAFQLATDCPTWRAGCVAMVARTTC